MADLSTANRILYVADNLRVMRGLNSESVDLIATDPPFDTKRLHNAPMGSKSAGQQFDDRWRWDEVTDEWHDVIASAHPAIKEIIEAAAVIEGGSVDAITGAVDTGRTQNSIAAFIAWMAPRVVEMHRLLKPTGSIYLHCNHAANSYLRLLLDAVFGRHNFGAEIIWRKTPKNPTRSFGKEHDTILFYHKSRTYRFNIVRKPYMRGHVKKRYKIEPDGRARYSSGGNVLTGKGKTDGPSCDPWRGFDPAKKNRHWAIPGYFEQFMDDDYLKLSPTEKLEALYKKGLVEIKPGNAWPIMVRYLDERSGVALGDIWAYQPYTEGTVWGTDSGIEEEVKWLPSTSPERTDWETQKPIALYSRMIKVSSDPGDFVLDPFAGCATTCVAAELLERRWIGIDIDPVAEHETKRRLAKETGLFGEKGGYMETHNPVQVKKNPPKRTDIPKVSDAEMRLSLWKKQGHKCANPYCSSGILRKEDLELDHVIPRARGGADDVMNRIGLCGNCNSRKRVKAWGAFLDQERAKQPHPTVASQ